MTRFPRCTSSPPGTRDFTGTPPNFAAEIGYSAAELVVLALQKAGRDLTADSFIAALESIKDYQDIFGSLTMKLQHYQTPGFDRSLPLPGEGREVGAGRHRIVQLSEAPYSTLSLRGGG